MSPNPSWKEIDRLISEQKYQAALERVDELLAEAREDGDEAEWTRAIVRHVQLETSLHGYETAVRFLREEPWPEGAQHRLVLDLFYAHSLVTYLRSYSWEIRQRERTVSLEEVDLKAWTLEQIVTEAHRAYRRVWDGREAWGAESLGELGEYLEQNNYPPRIRGTLRDAVTYLWVEFLSDTSLWRPEHSNELFRLDLEELLEAGEDEAAETELTSPDVHPLAKIDALSSDLETWHEMAERPEAAFEARLERIRRLRPHFSTDDDRQVLIADLRAHLEKLGRQYPWWSVGKALEAELVSQIEEPDALIRAREIALEGRETHPSSIGGKQCQTIVARIEAPSYHISAMRSDGPDQRSIEIDHKNLERLYFRAYTYDLEKRLASARDHNLLPAHREVDQFLQSGEIVHRWSVDLPPTTDYRSHKTFDTPPFDTAGAYLVVASGREDFADTANQKMAVNLLVTDLVLLVRRDGSNYRVTARSGSSGRALEGAGIDLYRFDWNARQHQRVATATSGTDGSAEFDASTWERRPHFFVARHQGQLAFDDQHYQRFDRHREQGQTTSLIYTDRSIYRPDQKISWKVVAYRSEPGKESLTRNFATLPGTELEVELLDPNGEVVASVETTTNDFGSAAGEFTVPSGRLLGRWLIQASIGGGTSIAVEEYKRPTFEVEIGEPAEALRLNRRAELGGEARYYFGLPVAGGEVLWRVTREPVYPPWWWWYPPTSSPQVIAGGEAELEPDGTFEIAFTPEADEKEADDGVSYRYRLSVDVTDEGGETRSAERTFRLGFVAIQARIATDRGFFRAGSPARFDVTRSDLDGTARSGSGTFRLVRLDQPAETLLPAEMPPLGWRREEDPHATPGDRLRPRWASFSPEREIARWDDGEELRRGELEHGGDGLAPVELDALAPGAYRLHYSTEDAFGALFETRQEFVVAPPPGEGTAEFLRLPAVLLAEHASVDAGERARFFVHTGLGDQEMVFELYRGGEVFERKLLGSGPQVIEIPVGEDRRGGFSAQLVTLRDHQLMSFGERILVPWDDRELKVEFATFRDRLRPGAEETWRVTVRGAEGELLEAGAAEVLAYMYDRSLDIFASHAPPSVTSLYPIFWEQFFLNSSLGSAHRVWNAGSGFANVPAPPHLRGDRIKFYDGYPIGGPGRRGGMMLKQRMAVARAAPAAPAAAEAAFDAEAVAEAPVLEERALSASRVAGEAADGGPPEEGAPPAAEPEEPVELRTDFSETAFWHPQLLLEDDGSVSFEFEVPDSVTEWNLWAHAVTRDLRGGSAQERVKTVKELLVRPYLPRFLREGDRAELKVVINNAGKKTLNGVLDFDVLDPETEESLLAEFGLEETAARGVPFEVESGGGTELTFGIDTPRRLGEIAIQATARAGDFSDGERRPLPVLPGRLHLAQSRFAALDDAASRTLRFEDMTADDPTLEHDLLAVTLDGQLFYGLLDALPYLVDYPYECTEQTLERFLATGILSSLYGKYPAVAEMAEQLAERETRYEAWNADDPNRKMLLEETPWLRTARGGSGPDEDLLRVLDPALAEAVRVASLAELEKTQTAIGAFPWWPGGPPSPYMTLYIVYGFSKALEFGVEVPRPMIEQAWRYLHRHYLDEWARQLTEDECCWEMITFLNYVLSSYPDASWTGGVFTEDDRRRMLDFSFRHWKAHSPMLKGQLALTLERAGRSEDAELVWESVMDSARTDDELGTYWAREERSWLWYNDTVETHAMALRTLTELDPDDERRKGLVQWLFLDKKLNHWKSTRATAEVIYSVAHYLDREEILGVREEALVEVGPRHETFVFEPDRYTGKNQQLVIEGEEIDPATMSEITVSKETPGLLFASATWHFSTEKLPEEARGDFFELERRFYRRRHDGREWLLEPLEEGARLEVGDQVEVQIDLRSKHAAEYVHLRAPRGAGFEPESTSSGYRWDAVGYYEEVRDSGNNFFFEWLPVGEYTFKYRLRANLAGKFRVGPALVQSMYAPEFVAYSSGAELEIVP